ncbi:MAG: hypothetical protein PW843_27260 [Azospirillaceae bacterium]|nr:hypothetical protein [Azospirillaceae bacterium]
MNINVKMAKNILKMVSALVFCSFSVHALAGYSQVGLISGLIAGADGVITIYTSTGLTSAPSCATANRFSLNASTTGGQSTLSALITAYNIKQNVQVVGTGNCTIISDSEDIAYVVYIN